MLRPPRRRPAQNRTLGSINSMSIEGRRNMISRIWFFFFLAKVNTSREQGQHHRLTCSYLPLRLRPGRQRDSLDKSNWRPLPRHRDHTEEHHILHRNKAVRSERKMDRLMGTMGGAAVQAYRDASRRTGPTFVLSKVDVITWVKEKKSYVCAESKFTRRVKGTRPGKLVGSLLEIDGIYNKPTFSSPQSSLSTFISISTIYTPA